MSKLPLATMPFVRSGTAAFACLVLACGFSRGSLPARAADSTWLGTASTLWTNASNWDPGTGTPGVADTAVFNGAGNGNTTIDLSGTASLFGVFFDTSSAAAYTIGSGGVNAQRLQLANSGTVAMASAVTANQTLNAVLALGTNASAGSYTLQNDSLTNTLTVSGSVLGGSGGTAGAKTLTLAGVGNTTLSGVIAHGGASSVAVTKSGVGTATLTGANSYTGATTISGGTLQIGNGGTTGSLSTSSAISVASGAAVVFNRSDAYGNLNGQTFGTVSGAGSIVLQTGTLFVSTNSLTGGIVVNGGQLDIGSATPMDAAGRLTINGGILSPRLASRIVANSGSITNDFQVGAVGNANALTLSGSFDLAGGTRTVTAVGTGATFSGILYNGALTKSGTSTLVLTNANTYTGTTSVLVGTLQVGTNGTAGSISSSSVLVLGGGRLTLNRSDAATQAFASTTLAPGVSTVSANTNNTVNFGAITRQPGATLNIAATGTFITSSANTNGILGGGILYNNSAFAVANGASAITGLSSFVNSSTAGNTPANYANANINLDSSQSPTGAIAPNSLQTGQGPTLTLANTLNTIQSGGILVLNQNSNPVVITGGTLTGPSGGDIVVTTFKTTSTSLSINSVIVDNGGPLGFTMGGTGRVALGGANTYSGTTTINGGILIARNTSAFGTGPVIVRAAATLGTQVTGTIANPIQLNATLALNPSGSSSTLSGVISGAGLLSIPSGVSGTIAFAGDNTFTGNIQFGTDAAAGGPTVLVATRSTSFGLGTKTISLSSVVNSYNRTVALDGSGGDFTLGSTISYTLSNDGSGGSPAVLNIAGNNTIAGAISMTTGGGGMLVQSDAGSLTLAGNITSVSGYRALILGGAAGGTVSGTVGDNGANTAGITKQGAGTWTLAAANTYTGTTAINAGMLLVASTGRINTSAAVTINGGELKYNSTTALTAPITFTAGTLSGTGTIGTSVTVASGDILSPGNSPGSQVFTGGLTWSPGGAYDWEVKTLTGIAGTNWDLLDVTAGGLDLNGLSTSNRFNLNLLTLTGSNTAGPLEVGYATGSTHEFLIASFNSLTVPSGFSSTANSDLTGLFTISLAGWLGPKPSLSDISVKVNSSGTGIALIIVPEPRAVVFAGIGMAMAGWSLWKRRRA